MPQIKPLLEVASPRSDVLPLSCPDCPHYLLTELLASARAYGDRAAVTSAQVQLHQQHVSSEGSGWRGTNFASNELPLLNRVGETPLPSCNQFGWARPTSATRQQEPRGRGRSRTSPRKTSKSPGAAQRTL